MSRVTNSDIPDGSAPSVRTDIENTFKAVISLFSGTGPPDAGVRVPFMLYVDVNESPPGLYMWNPGDTAGIKIGEVGATTIKLFSEGAALPALTAANLWTAIQEILVSGSTGILKIGSTLSAGEAAALSLLGNNGSGVQKELLRLGASWVVNTAGAEVASGKLQLLGSPAGTFADLLTFQGTAFTFPGSIAVTGAISQGGTALTTLIANAIGSLEEHSNWSGATKSTDGVTAGQVITYTGSGATTLTVRKRTRRQLIAVEHAGPSGLISLVSDTAPNRVTFLPDDGLTLGAGKICFIRWRDADADLQVVRVTGENV